MHTMPLSPVRKKASHVECDASGMFDEILNLTTGGNFVMIDYDDFTGQITMDCAYVD